MLQTGQTVLFALFVWYMSTGVILYLDGLPARTFRFSMLGMTALSAAALCGLSAVRPDTSVSGAYCGFTCGVVFWAWQEMAFLMGFLTGPRPLPPPAGCSEWRRFAYAVRAILWHELAILGGAVLALAVCRGAANQFGAWTFLLLWGMRQSAKLNCFLGVRNLNEDLLPGHLAFLKGYLTRRPFNALFPLSILAATALTVWLARLAMAAPPGSGQRSGMVLLASMAMLGLIEHWVLVLPVPFARLWQWSLASRPGRSRANPPALRTAHASPPRADARPQPAR